ncbi:MAG: Tim44 domain-containing protein [Sulfuriferula sp.]|nr:Tim44 domain-containing protein [Sulfuriferula sp.]
MRKFFNLVLVMFISMSLMTGIADAKRFGGGKSFGKQRESISQTAPTRAPMSAPPAAAPAKSGMSKWLGPLAGLAAGGLLASMFMGHGFDGIKGMDILMMIALAAGAFFLFRMLRRTPAPGTQQQPATAYTGYSEPVAVPAMGSGGGYNAAPQATSTRPDWFDDAAFVREAKSHFIRLQAAYDAADLNDIREYTTPEIFAEISMQIQERGTEPQKTEVTLLNADVIDVVTEADFITVSVRFHGLIREVANAPAEPFNEIWHIQKPANDRSAPWHIAGIQQAQ